MDIDTGSFAGMTRSPRKVAERTMDPLHFRVTRRTYTSLPSSEQHGKADDEGAMWRLIGTIRISKPIVGASFVVGRGAWARVNETPHTPVGRLAAKGIG
jgi:hypothetical protein